MTGPIDGWYDFSQLGQQRASFEADLQARSLDRLQDLVAADSPLHTKVQFELQGATLVRITVDGELPMTCQRCLDEMVFPLSLDIGLALFDNEAAAALAPEGYEAAVVEEGRVNPAQLVEDEVILALPMVAKHQEPCTGANERN